MAGRRVATRELADRRGLAGPVDPHDEHDRRSALDRRLRHPDEVAGDQPRGKLGADVGQRALGTLAEAGLLDDIHRQRCADVTGDERLLDVIPGRIIGAGPDGATEAGHEAATGALETRVERTDVLGLGERRRSGDRLGLGGRGGDRLGLGGRFDDRRLDDRHIVTEVGGIRLPARFDVLGARRDPGRDLRLRRFVPAATPERHQPAVASSLRRPASAWASSSRRLMTRLTESSPTVTP